MVDSPYRLIYWPGLPGRGEFVRLAFEAARTPYVDTARLSAEQGGGAPEVLRYVRGDADGPTPFAPPILVHEGLVIAQVANILQYLGPRLGLVPPGETARLRANQLQLTLADVISEAHDTHHPLGSGFYYRDHPEAARIRARFFAEQRLGRFLAWFDRALLDNGGKHLVGDALSYVDLSYFQVITGLAHAFPKALARAENAIKASLDLRDRVAEHLADYLASDRRQAFNEDGIFRWYPELDF